MSKPNILIFMTDQQRADSIPPFQKAKTPNLERFCKEGVVFPQAYCCSPHCCPSRAAFFSGLYPTQHGVWNNVNVGNALSTGLYNDVRLWSEDLKEAGYDLFFNGKWHVDCYKTPADYGWEMGSVNPIPDKYEEGVDIRRPHIREWVEYLNLKEVKEKEQRSEGEIIRPGYRLYTHYGEMENPFNDMGVVNEAIGWMKRQCKTGRPWCRFVGTLGPHDPYYVPKKFLDMYKTDDIELPDSFSDCMADKPNLYKRTRARFDQLTEREHKEAIRHYLAFCSYEDALFGELLESLEEMGEAENTLVLYISDHGDYMGDHGLWCKGLPCFKSAYHIPCAVRWPKGIKNPGRIIEEFISIVDLAPTFLELAGIPPKQSLTGQSLVAFFEDEKPEMWRDAIFTQSNGNELYGIQRSVMTKKWKYVYNGFDFDELYDLENDPEEIQNVINKPENQEIVRKLIRRIWDFAYKTQDVCINSYITVSLAPYGPGEAFRDD